MTMEMSLDGVSFALDLLIAATFAVIGVLFFVDGRTFEAIVMFGFANTVRQGADD